jgi:hypothetical protein
LRAGALAAGAGEGTGVAAAQLASNGARIGAQRAADREAEDVDDRWGAFTGVSFLAGGRDGNA